MASRYPVFDRSQLRTLPLAKRKHDLHLKDIRPLEPCRIVDETLSVVASRIVAARSGQSKRPVVLMMGAHVLRAGVQRYLIDLMEQGYLSCIATNGAGVIHDFEFALIGATTETVASYIEDGRFGMWHETGRLNDVVRAAAEEGLGLGEAVGKVIEEERFPHKDISILAAGHRLGVPITVHVGIGYDIVHEHANCDGSAYGAASYTDFLIFAKVLEGLPNGVLMTFGSAVMAPEVYLKALAMVRNAAHQTLGPVSGFTTLVCDLRSLPSDYGVEACRDDPGYYFRPWKTMLIRTVADGGESFYVEGSHSETIPKLWTAVTRCRSLR
jgi:hypothetical protein